MSQLYLVLKTNSVCQHPLNSEESFYSQLCKSCHCLGPLLLSELRMDFKVLKTVERKRKCFEKQAKSIVYTLYIYLGGQWCSFELERNEEK